VTPAVSIVMATRNYGRFLRTAIDSVVAQTFGDWELIVVDDGSTDETPEILNAYRDDARIRPHRTDGLGQPRAKNLGIQLARGPLIAFLDGDDAWLPDKLERQLPLFERPAVGVVYSRRILMDEAGANRDGSTTPPLVRGWVYDSLLVQNCVCYSSCVVRRGVFESVGLFDPNLPLAIDYDLWLRVARHYEFDYADAPLVRYRTGHANLSTRLTERIGTVFRIMRRSLVERDNAPHTAPEAIREAHGSTCRTMAYAVRTRSRLEAARWYLRAARHDGRWRATLRSLAGLTLGHNCSRIKTTNPCSDP
jgi:glycosyltransferase involved in cell wall biosynthesis